MTSSENTLFIGGQSRLPKELSQGESLQVVMELDQETGRVIDVSFGPTLPIIQNLLSKLIVGMSLEKDSEALFETIRTRLQHRSQKAVIAAVRDLLREYNEYKTGPKTVETAQSDPEKIEVSGNRLEDASLT